MVLPLIISFVTRDRRKKNVFGASEEILIFFYTTLVELAQLPSKAPQNLYLTSYSALTIMAHSKSLAKST